MNGDEEVNGRGWEMVAAGSATSAAAYDGDDFSVFPPCLHEGLTPALFLDSRSLSSSPSASASIEVLEESKLEEEEEEEVVPHVSRARISESARRLVDSGIELVRSKIAARGGRGGGGGCDGGAVWSFAAVAGFAGVLMYMRRRHLREKQHLLFMILEKDERINQLMDQIVKMSEAFRQLQAAAAAPSPSGRSRTRASKKVAAAAATPVNVSSNRKSKAGSAGTIIKVRNEKLGERISALQQLVSPFGKTDTATVLHEAIGYIR